MSIASGAGHLINLFCRVSHTTIYGKILVIMEADKWWRLVTPNNNELVESQGTSMVQVWFGESTCDYSYILESRGEILWVSINTREYNRNQMGSDPQLLKVKVSVQALEEPLLSQSLALEKMVQPH
ncbi:28 kDa ribonucleoprotein, chloroplastic [Hordeum vulgare]|nr:28 kDa ribonucleoprotein, chloroplastic [Hordeum vulgare]